MEEKVRSAMGMYYTLVLVLVLVLILVYTYTYVLIGGRKDAQRHGNAIATLVRRRHLHCAGTDA